MVAKNDLSKVTTLLHEDDDEDDDGKLVNHVSN